MQTRGCEFIGLCPGHVTRHKQWAIALWPQKGSGWISRFEVAITKVLHALTMLAIVWRDGVKRLTLTRLKILRFHE